MPIGIRMGKGGSASTMPGEAGGSSQDGGAAPIGRGTSGKLATPGGKALLSWRVALLPYLGERRLYSEFRLDEPWDSPHNKKLLDRMPNVYAPPGIRTREPYTTFYQVLVGGGAVFEEHQRPAFPTSITDGISYTILIAEAGTASPWTKPEDLHYAPDAPLPELGGLFPKIINVALADGSAIARQECQP